MKKSIFFAKIAFVLLFTSSIFGQNIVSDIPKCKVTSNFSVNELDCDTFQFTALITSGTGTTITGYVWDFGDGTTVNYQSPVTHTYTSNGTYTVKLAVYGSYLNSDGSQSLCKDTKIIQLVVNCPSTDCGVINNFYEYNDYCDDEVIYRAHNPGLITLNPGWTITQYKWIHEMSGGSTIVAYGSPSTVSMPCDIGFVDKTTLEVTATNIAGETCILTKYRTLLSGGSKYINGQCCLNKTAIDVYPNPVSDNLMIKANFPESELELNGSISFELYDIYGVKVVGFVANMSESISQINVSNLESGIYFLKVINNGEVIKTTRILKN